MTEQVGRPGGLVVGHGHRHADASAAVAEVFETRELGARRIDAGELVAGESQAADEDGVDEPGPRCAVSPRATGTSIDLLIVAMSAPLAGYRSLSVRNYPPDSVGNHRRRPRPPAARSILGAERREAA